MLAAEKAHRIAVGIHSREVLAEVVANLQQRAERLAATQKVPDLREMTVAKQLVSDRCKGRGSGNSHSN